ncbi:cupin domain-containing protein [Rhodocytophaga rosea]|uniref:Cupin domain-containing protein n=1 Tax=Rhodocytophaga rosea TaxID=2704465 RepID=A0A6C0GKK8_9BACT|nr:cupin domain-containing protein [Rhodocytophaga rosea]QHT68548.1 cupin domain-containing protein [Rhodocytophaga rosea]
MERRDFLSTTVIGSMGMAGSPTESFYQTITDTPSLKPFTIAPGVPLSPGPGNMDVRTIIHSSQTNKQFSNIEGALGPKQMGPAPHIHKDLDELMYVLEGTATIMIGKELYTVEAGGWNFRPRGIVHTFWNASDKPLRFIDCFFNQNLEDYLDELFHQIIPDMMKKNLTPAAPEIASRIAALDKKFGITWFHEQRQGIIDKYGLKA